LLGVRERALVAFGRSYDGLAGNWERAVRQEGRGQLAALTRTAGWVMECEVATRDVARVLKREGVWGEGLLKEGQI